MNYFKKKENITYCKLYGKKKDKKYDDRVVNNAKFLPTIFPVIKQKTVSLIF